jgi:hypothetical protein
LVHAAEGNCREKAQKAQKNTQVAAKLLFSALCAFGGYPSAPPPGCARPRLNADRRDEFAI